MRHFVWIFVGALCGCAQLVPSASVTPRDAPETVPSASVSPAQRPPATARSAEEFDTTTAAQRDAARASAPVATARSLGATIVSLGDPADPGFWMDTPLVRAPTPGRVVLGGQSASVTLRPIDGPSTGGSRLSLAAMRLLNVPLTALPEVEVFAD